MNQSNEQLVIALSRGFLREKLATLGAKGGTESAASICHEFFKYAMDDMSNPVIGAKATVAGGGRQTHFERAVTEYHRALEGQDYTFGLLELIQGCLIEWISEAKDMKKLVTEKNTVLGASESRGVREVLQLVEMSATVLVKQSLQTIKDFARGRSIDFNLNVLENKPPSRY